MKIAVIGSGVSGLVAADELHKHHRITVFERNHYVGGHAHTQFVKDADDGHDLSLDTGFIVFNEVTYPNFTRLLKRLNVRSQPAEMSFGVKCDSCRLEFSSRGLGGIFAQASNILSPALYRLVVEILRFNRWAQKSLRQARDIRTVDDLRSRNLFSDELFRHYLIPMTAAIWSSNAETVGQMPFQFLVKFFSNHHLLQTHRHPQWRTISGGSHHYVEALAKPFAERIRLNTKVRQVERHSDLVRIYTDVSGWERFDQIVIATHTDQALAMLKDADTRETRTLSAIEYRRNIAVLHADERQLPRALRARASWNYHVPNCRNDSASLRVTYFLTRLQRLRTHIPYCVTLNPPQSHNMIDPSKEISRMSYSHPVYSSQSMTAGREIADGNGSRRTTYCGAYLGNGFHEDGVLAGLRAAQTIKRMPEAV